MNVIIIGDVMIDINYISKVQRFAPESVNTAIYNISDINYVLGGAANVAKNLKNLGINVEIITVIGEDFYGNEIKKMFGSSQLKNKIFIDKERQTTQKNRIFVNDKLNVRYDIESTHDISSNDEDEIINYVLSKSNIDAIIISDYDKGVITEKLCQTIISYANKKHIPTFVDPKLKNYMKYKGCFLFKPNQTEAETISGEKNIHNILHFIKNKIDCKNILLTRGKEGMILNNVYNKIEHESIINLIDVTGAGDVVLSVLVYVFIKEKDLLKACKIANYIGGKSVGVIGNYSVNLNDINEYDALDINIEKTNLLILLSYFTQFIYLFISTR